MLEPSVIGLQPITAPKHYREYVASGTVYRGQPVIVTGTTVAGWTTAANVTYADGVALNYAVAGEKVTVCTDVEQEYLCICNAIPAVLNTQWEYYGSGSDAGTASAGSPHTSAIKLSQASLASAPAADLVIHLMRPAAIPANPYGDGSGMSAVDNVVVVRLAGQQFTN
jgi:hypothetical protein